MPGVKVNVTAEVNVTAGQTVVRLHVPPLEIEYVCFGYRIDRE